MVSPVKLWWSTPSRPFAIERAQRLDVGATAALMQIFLSLRPTEAMVRVVRDPDDEGRVLWEPSGKASNARRRLQVPCVLCEILLKHAKAKPVDAPLIAFHLSPDTSTSGDQPREKPLTKPSSACSMNLTCAVKRTAPRVLMLANDAAPAIEAFLSGSRSALSPN